MSSRIIHILVLSILLISIITPIQASSGSVDPLSKIHPLLLQKLQGMRGDEVVEVVVRIEPLPQDIRVQVKGNYRLAVSSLMTWARTTQEPIVNWVRSVGGVVLNTFWLDNVILIKIPAKYVYELAKNPSVVKIFENFEVRIVEPVYREESEYKADQVSSWGIFKIRAPEAWALGITGEGIRIAVLDTGVDVSHPALAGKMLSVIPGDPYYPGGWMEFDSNGNPVRSTPHDTHGHGTHTSGTALGGNTNDILIGVAPGATLMHGLVLPGGGGSFAQVLAGMQWTVNPFYLTPDGQRIYTGLPAHVVSMSWGASEYYSNDLLPAIEAMLLANIIPVAAIGNDGPGYTSNPGNIWGTFGIGATDINDNVASWSSGKVVTWPSPPATWPFFDMYPSTYIKPDLSAPGVSITSAVPGGGYEAWSGTSMATPHVSGTVALMLQAAGWFNYDVPDIPEKIYLALNSTAIDFGDPGQDIRYGWGRIDAYEAVRKAMEYAKKSGVEGYVYDSVSGEPIKWATVTVLETGTTYKVNASGYFKIPLDPGTYTLLFSGWGYYNETITVEVVLLNGTITGVVSDAYTGNPIANAIVTVEELNLSVTTDEYGVYEVTVPPGTYTLTAEATGYYPSSTTVTVDEGEVVYVDFQLYSLGNGTLAGYVVDANTGLPIEDAIVWTTVDGTPVETYTDINGYYELSLPAGEYTVHAWKPGYTSAEANVTIYSGVVTWLNFTLTPIPPVVVVLANVHYYTSPHLKTIIQNLGLPVVEYNDMDVLLNDWVNGNINPKVVVIDHTKPSAYNYPSESTVLAFHLLADAYGASLIWLCTSYSGYPGIYVLYQYSSTLINNGYPAPVSRQYSYPSPTYVQVEMLNTSHPIFSGVTPDVPGYDNRFYLGTGSYVDYVVYTFNDPTGRLSILGYVRDTRYTDRYGVGVAEWISNTNAPWYYLGSWAESYWMQYLEPGADGMYTSNTKKVLENAVLLGYGVSPTFNKELLARALKQIVTINKPIEVHKKIRANLYTWVEIYMNRLPYGYVTGRVLGSDGAILAGADVKVLNTPVVMKTNETGVFYTWLPSGTYTLEISYPGYARKYIDASIVVNQTTDLGDIVLRALPRIAILNDYMGSLKQFFEANGWYAQDYSDIVSLTNDIRAGLYQVVIYSGYYGVGFPTHDQFIDFLNATFEKGVGVIWMDSWGYYGYGIKVLNAYLGDPSSIGYSYGYPVYIVVTKTHPILRGYSVGDVIPIVTYSWADYSWFTGFSGEAIANTYAGGIVWGNSIAWKVFDNGVKWVLLSSFAPTQWNTPSYFTSDAWNIIYNSARWIITKPLNTTLENPYLCVGDTAVLHVSGAPAYTELYIYLDGEYIGSVETDENGTATYVFKVPLIPGGEHVIEVMTEDNIYYGYTSLYVLAKIIITPTIISTPGTVYVEATGLQPYQSTLIYLDGNYLSQYKANESGAFTIKINIPLVEAGLHDIVLIDPGKGDVLLSETILTYSKLDTVIDILNLLLNYSDQLEAKLDTIINDTAIIKTGLGTISVKLDTILDKLDKLNATIIGVKNDTVYIKTKIGDLEVKLDTLLARSDQLGAKIDVVINDTAIIKTKIGDIPVKLDTLLNKINVLNATVAGIAGDTVFIKTKIGDLEVKLDTLLKYNTTLNQILNALNNVKSDTGSILTKISDLTSKIDTIDKKQTDLSNKIDEKAGGAASYSMGALVVSIIVLLALIATQFMGRKT